MIGPFIKKTISTLRISPIGLVPKKSGFHLITHLSYPDKLSVNHFIDPEICKVKYSSIDNVLDMISALGQKALCAKMDICQAFRLLIINPADFDLLGIMFGGKYYVDKCLPMGCSISCSLFEKFATFVHWVVASKSVLETLDHYLDDFFFAGESFTQNCAKLMETFVEVCKELGVPLAEDKTIGPTTQIRFLGMEIDTFLMVVRIPQDKLERLKLMLLSIISKKRIALKELVSVTRIMAFCSTAISSSRAFIRRFYDLIASVKNGNPYYSVCLNREVKEDAMVWLEFLEKINGECYIPERYWITNEALELFTDSTGNALLGCGAYLSGHWVQYRWPSSWENTEILTDITFLELVPIVLSLIIWGPEFKNKKILLHIDNQALVSIINK
jgi:hypothetical protein